MPGVLVLGYLNHCFREGACEAVYIGGERRVLMDYSLAMVANDDDDRGVGAFRVMQVGDCVGKAGSQVEE
jgi:hypothetical protein